MPRYGQSDKDPTQRTALAAQGEVFIETIKHWQLDRPALLAHDVRAHLLHGCECGRYALMNVVAMRPWSSEFFEFVGRHIHAFSWHPEHIHRVIIEGYIQGALASELRDDDLLWLMSPWLTDEGRGSLYCRFAQADEQLTAVV